jgi:hypothetical protein
VLDVRLPKTPDAMRRQRKIEVKNASFFCRLTNGLTWAGAINRTQ